tara:strand:+ start:21279 stop:22289 length:1011 start_codon:yes stop_codon:yes gene_type:complete
MILLSYGTRPEWIKLKPIVDKLQLPHRILFTGQHEDLAQGEYDFRLKFPECENRLDAAFAAIANTEFLFHDIKYVLVQGDTASAFAVALAAFHRGIKVIHLEAGLRSFNLQHPYPEEFYRKTISSFADVHLCPTKENADNIIAERNTFNKVHVQVVGNTVCDNLKKLTPEYGDEVLVTLHRRENHFKMEQWFTALDGIAANNPELTFTLPLHPNPNVSKHKHILKHVNVVDPIPYEEFIERLSKCRLVISDSGGIQEESAFLGKRCLVCREYTERVEGVGEFSTLCRFPHDLAIKAQSYINDYKPKTTKCPYGDGNSADRVVKVLENLWNDDIDLS